MQAQHMVAYERPWPSQHRRSTWKYEHLSIAPGSLDELARNDVPGIRVPGFLPLHFRRNIARAGSDMLEDACWIPHVRVAGGCSIGKGNVESPLSHLFLYFSQVAKARWMQLRLANTFQCPYQRLQRLLATHAETSLKPLLSDDFGRFGDFFWMRTSPQGWPAQSIPRAEQRAQESFGADAAQFFWLCLLEGHDEESDLVTYNYQLSQDLGKHVVPDPRHLVDSELMYHQATPGTLLILNAQNALELLPGREKLWIGGHLGYYQQQVVSWT